MFSEKGMSQTGQKSNKVPIFFTEAHLLALNIKKLH